MTSKRIPKRSAQHLGHIDSTEVYFCSVGDYAAMPMAMATIGATVALVDANRDIDETMRRCLSELTVQGAVHVILTGSDAYAYEDVLDRIIVDSGIERLQHCIITTIPIVDLEEAINLAVCMDEEAILVVGDDLNDLLPGLLDFGMEK